MKNVVPFLTISLALASTLSGLTIDVQKILDGQPLPFGYQETNGPSPDFSSTITPSEVLNLSAGTFVDYLIPRNDGTIGIHTQKAGGSFITSNNADDPGGTAYGSNQWPDPDRWHPVFEWTDGAAPNASGSDYWGVSHSGWGSSDVSQLDIRIDLATMEEVTVYHWFNDGWLYEGRRGPNHDTLTGHTLTVTHFNAVDAVIGTESVLLTQGGAESYFGDHRIFATATITATATAPGDYLILSNVGANIGYKGTAVSVVPEPAALALMAGMLCLAVVLWQRRA
ncbi:MAG: hypothetical protein AB3N64_14805 [Puniceicoccaceae bacterium]